MSITEAELEGRLGEIEEPLIGDDIVSLDLINDVTIDGDVADEVQRDDVVADERLLDLAEAPFEFGFRNGHT